ncbi:hypothetical protein RB195_003162 [Necator americanus]|uniref:Uncharacterized protein n=1 Tax=Necator americanus TaxID=51031 RepID=A0ABR1DMF5_NECAM
MRKMKPKRRSTFSPASVETTLKSPRPKRKRFDSTSPQRRKSSNSSDEVKPPPEFIPFPYEKLCPKFRDLFGKNAEDFTLEKDDLLVLQHELERMLAHSADYLRRAHGEVTYLNTGEYPVQDLRTRPMPSYKLRETLPLSPTTTQEMQDTLCGLPEDDTEDNVDIWPPHHIPQRFWTWCKSDFLTPIDADYLKDFKLCLIDKYSAEELKEYYVNEPWKHRKRQRSRIASGDATCPRTRRKSSIDGPSAEKKQEHKKEKEEKKVPSTSSLRPTRISDSKLAPLISDVVCAASREMRKEEFTTPVRRLSLRLHSRDDGEDERKISVKSEPSDLSNHDTNDGVSVDVVQSNGITQRSPISSRLHSPRIKKESREEMDDYWDRPGPSNAHTLPNGKCNGELKSRLKRNGEVDEQAQPGLVRTCNSQWETFRTSLLGLRLRRVSRVSVCIMPIRFLFGFVDILNNSFTKVENGVQSNSPSKVFSPSSSAVSSVSEENEIERHYREIGSRIVKMLVERGLIPSSTEHVYREIATSSVERDLVVSHEGKEDDDDSDLDEVSEELLRCQMELQELEPRLRGVVSHCWSKVRGDFAYWETAKQLDDADTDLFRLGVNMYRDLPTRRVPTNTELPTLRAALRRRNRKARQHYGCSYKRLRKYRKSNIK